MYICSECGGNLNATGVCVACGKQHTKETAILAGQKQQAPQPAQQTAPQPSGGFGKAPAGFGAAPMPTGGGFGKAPAGGGFGQAPAGFGAAPAGGGFGAVPAAGGFGQAPAAGFGQAPAGGFGQPTPVGFGQMPAVTANNLSEVPAEMQSENLFNAPETEGAEADSGAKKGLPFGLNKNRIMLITGVILIVGVLIAAAVIFLPELLGNKEEPEDIPVDDVWTDDGTLGDYSPPEDIVIIDPPDLDGDIDNGFGIDVIDGGTQGDDEMVDDGQNGDDIQPPGNVLSVQEVDSKLNEWKSSPDYASIEDMPTKIERSQEILDALASDGSINTLLFDGTSTFSFFYATGEFGMFVVD